MECRHTESKDINSHITTHCLVVFEELPSPVGGALILLRSLLRSEVPALSLPALALLFVLLLLPRMEGDFGWSMLMYANFGSLATVAGDGGNRIGLEERSTCTSS